MPQINVIYCKDCKHFYPFFNFPYGKCSRRHCDDEVVKTTDYCSYAKQKYDDISDIVDNAQHTSSGLLEET